MRRGKRAVVLLAALLASALVSAADYSLPAPPVSDHLTFSAEHFDYDSSSSAVHLVGDVRVVESTPTLPGSKAPLSVKADDIWLDLERRTARSEGFLLVDDGYSAVYGDHGAFDYENHSGYLEHTHAGYGDVRVLARSLRWETAQDMRYTSADFTTCLVTPKPHYHFHSSRVRVVPHKYLLAYNDVFFIGPVPIFYTPFLYKSLRKKHFLRFKLQPGYDRRSGGFLKTTLLTNFGPHLYSKLYLDYYSSQGFGAGGELHERNGEDSRGALFGYRIRENQSTKRERWALIGDKYQTLPSSFSFQARMQVQSDADFNNNYARSSAFRVTPELINSAALVYRMRQATARLSYSRSDLDDGSRTHYVKSLESSPRLDMQTSALSLWKLPWLNTFTGFADNNYDRGRGFAQRSAGAAWEATQSIHVARGVSFTPRVGYSQQYLSRYDRLTEISSVTYLDTTVGRYLAGGDLRMNTPLGDWDVAHLYQRRQRPGSLTDDAAAIDHGVESDLLSVEDMIRPSRKVMVRFLSAYDFRKFRDHDLGFRQRVQPIVGEVVYVPKPALNFSVRDDYQLQEGNRSFLVSGQYGETDGNFVSGGYSHNKSEPRLHFLNAEFGWLPKAPENPPLVPSFFAPYTWRLGWTLRSVITTDGGFGRIGSVSLFEKELSLAKHFHDFYGRGMIRFRPGNVREFFFKIDMKLGTLNREQIARRDWESEWFPERARGIEDRP